VRESKITVAFIVVVVILMVVYLFVYQVREDEVAVHYRPPGKVLNVRNAGPAGMESGVYFRLPWPIDHVAKHDKRIRVLEGNLAETQLQDNWMVIISMYATWRIADPVSFERTLDGDVNQAEGRLKELIFNETSRAIGKSRFENLVSTDPEKLRFDAIEKEIADGVRQAIMAKDKGYGIELVSFGIRRVAIPEDVTKSVFARMNAERNKEAETYRSEGRNERDAIIATAKQDAQKILADAETQARQIRGEGEAEEAKYYDVFARAPELSIYLRRLEALQAIAQKAREKGTPITFVLDTQTEPLNVLDVGPQAKDKPAAPQK